MHTYIIYPSKDAKDKTPHEVDAHGFTIEHGCLVFHDDNRALVVFNSGEWASVWIQ